MEPNVVKQVKKRDGSIVDFSQDKIVQAIYKALKAVGRDDEALARELSDKVIRTLNNKFHHRSIPAIEEIQDMVEEVLIKEDLVRAAKAYIIYREQHAQLRELKKLIDSDDVMNGYLKQLDWRVKENANMAYSLQGLNNHVASAVSSHYWLNRVYPPEIREAHVSGALHLHDLQILAVYCCGWDLQALLRLGFGGVEGKVQSKPAKHLRVALSQIVNFFYTLQGEAAGAEAFANFDTLLAPFVRYDHLNELEVKQAMQEFIFGMNVPTRVGFQCMSQDTEILTKDGWRGYQEVKRGDIIATFNLEKGILEYLPVKNVFARKYKGKMYNLKNRISDQLISPEHRVVRRQFNGAGYVLEKIEKVAALKSPFMVPVAEEVDGQIKISDTQIDEVKVINYKGVIWCPNTDNETVVARRKGKIFITGNTPFTNLTFDLSCPSTLANEAIIIGGLPQKETYKEFQPEMDLINRAFAEVMMAGDAKGRVFTFPIPTYNISNDFDWQNKVLDPIWEMTAKYGIPYFANFINSDMKAEDARSMCCRLRLDNRELRKRGGGIFAANPLTGSIGVVTINLSRIGYLSKTRDEYFNRLGQTMDLCRQSLQLKREMLESFTEQGLYPYAKYYLQDIKTKFNEYWRNHFNTIGINGMNESLINFMNRPLSTKEGQEFTLEVMDFMLKRLASYQGEDNQLYNLEATPAEGATYRFAKKDKEIYPDIIVANEEAYQKHGAAPYYTNSTHFPVNYSTDLFEVLEGQDPLQTKYTGGTVVHGFLGERMPDIESTKSLVRKIAENFHLPYYTLTPTFSICPKHGYLPGEHRFCPICDEEIGYVREQEEKLPL